MSVHSMHKLKIRRRAVSTMIAGIIILVIFLSALVFMFVVSQQYDAYQTTAVAAQKQLADIYSENIIAVYPGVANGTGNPVGCGGGQQCSNYTLIVNNLGISTRIVRIYLNTTRCTGNNCVLDSSSAAAPNRFRASDGNVNQGESSHYVVFWLPSGTSLSTTCKVSIVTARGRVFSFLWPFPTIFSSSAAGPGGTGIYIGPLVITFQKALITYTDGVQSLPPIPLGSIGGSPYWYWVLPKTSGGGIIIYIKLQTDVGVQNDVYLTPQSVFEIAQFTSPGAVIPFFAVAPITSAFCQYFVSATYNPDLDCTLSTYTSPGPHNNDGNPKSPGVVAYQKCGNPPQTYSTCPARYVIPKPDATQFQNHQKGTPVIVAFAVFVASGGSPGSLNLQTIPWSNVAVTSFLGLSYVWDDGTGPYLYGVTLPFIAFCIGDTNTPPTACSR
jgi:hypothetical protein